MICGFYTPTEGEILFNGVNYIENKEFPKDIGALIENPSFLPEMTGYQNLELLASIQNKIGNKEIIESLEKVNLIKDKDKKYSKYSLGMKQKLGVAQALMENPKIIILDEPFNCIENETAEKLRKLLLEEKRLNKIIILASHIKEDVSNLADVVYEFDNGNVKKIMADRLARHYSIGNYYFPSLSFLYPSYLSLANCSVLVNSSFASSGKVLRSEL